MKRILAFAGFVLWLTSCSGQVNQMKLLLDNMVGLIPTNVALQVDNYLKKKSVKVVDTAAGNNSEVKYVKIKDIQFHNGIIEVELAGKPLSTATESARGFVGIAFRIEKDDSKFECIYLRPTNGRANDQVRRNHSLQYISYPDYPWQRLRKETPEKYESYVDLQVGQWTKVKIEVQDSIARLYVHGALQPALIVTDLKGGTENRGSIGLWIGPGTEAHFRNLLITIKD